MKCSNIDEFFSLDEVAFFLEPFKNKTVSVRNTNYVLLSSLNNVFDALTTDTCVFIFFRFQTLSDSSLSPSLSRLSSSVTEILNSCFTSSVLFHVFLLTLSHFESCNQNKTLITWLLSL